MGEFKGEVLVRDENITVLEGGWKYSKTIVMKFDSEQEALSWRESPAYQAIARIRRGCASTNLVLAQGET